MKKKENDFISTDEVRAINLINKIIPKLKLQVEQ